MRALQEIEYAMRVGHGPRVFIKSFEFMAIHKESQINVADVPLNSMLIKLYHPR